MTLPCILAVLSSREGLWKTKITITRITIEEKKNSFPTHFPHPIIKLCDMP